MACRGQTKFVCAECGEFTYFHGEWAKARHTRDRCRHCGSAMLDPWSPKAVAEQWEVDDRRILGAGKTPRTPRPNLDCRPKRR